MICLELRDDSARMAWEMVEMVLARWRGLDSSEVSLGRVQEELDAMFGSFSCRPVARFGDRGVEVLFV